MTARLTGDAAASALCAEYEAWLHARGVTIDRDPNTNVYYVLPGEYRTAAGYRYWALLTSTQGALFVAPTWRACEQWVNANREPIPARFLDADNYNWGE